MDVPRAKKGRTEEPRRLDASAARKAETVVREERSGVLDSVWMTLSDGAFDSPDSSTVIVKGGRL